MTASFAGAAHNRGTAAKAHQPAPTAAAAQASASASATASLFPLQAVRLDGGVLGAAQQRNLAYLLALDPQRLLAPFRRSAGLPTGPGYGSWESTGLDGHMAGHVLSALALAVAATGDTSAQARLRTLLQALDVCQQAVAGDALMAGYLGGIPEGRQAWVALAGGQVQADSFQLNGRWVPWYNLHKTGAGLRDAWLQAGEPLARRLLLGLADWVDRCTQGLSEAQMQAMLRTEHGGMAELLADLADACTEAEGRSRWRALALRFVDRGLLAPLAAGQDPLTGLHANTQLPKVLAWQRLGEQGALPEGEAAARFFWQRVVQHRSVPLGGHGVREHFHDVADFSALSESVEGPESCNAVNMLLLAGRLWQRRPERAPMDHAERTLFNQVLSAQHPRTGGLVYFTPLRPHHHRVYSTVHEGMWCCVGTGLEVHSRHAQWLYGHDAATLWVNLFAPSTLQAPEHGLHLRQRTGFPDDGDIRLDWLAPTGRTLALRLPAWAEASAGTASAAAGAGRTVAGHQLWRNGRALRLAPGSDGYLHLPGPWLAGDTVRLRLRLAPRLEGLPDGSAQRSLLAGPIVLATRSAPALQAYAAQGGPAHSHAPGPDGSLPPPQHFGDDSRMGHIAHGPLSRPEATLVLRQPQALLADLQPVPGRPLHFRTQALAPAGAPKGARAPVLLEPFFRLHEARYQLMWPVLDSAELERRAAERDRHAREQAALAARTVDSVAPGEQQPEADHAYAGEGGDTGLHQGRRWRHATGWFEYTLRDPQRQARWLQLTLHSGDAARNWQITLNGQPLPRPALRTSAQLGDSAPEGFYTLDIALPEDAADAQGRLRLRWVAGPGSVAGGLYGLRLLR